MNIIASLQNARIKEVVKLRVRKKRDADRVMIIEGELELERGLRNGVRVKEVYFHSGSKRIKGLVEECEMKQAGIFECEAAVFEKIAYGNRTEGILALAPYGAASLESITLPDDPLVLVLEALEKPGNLGAILRTADAAGADAVIVCDPATDLYNPNVVRTSRGTLFTVMVSVADSEAVHTWLSDKGLAIIGAAPEAEPVLYDQLYTGPTALVLGTEDKGLSRFWKEAADRLVRIPMRGAADSLNVSAAAAILLYEAVRHRNDP